jgi:hypothetical protein
MTVEEFFIKRRGCVRNGIFIDYIETEDILKFTKLKIKELLYSDEQILKMDSKIQSAAVISNMRVNKIIENLK